MNRYKHVVFDAGRVLWNSDAWTIATYKKVVAELRAKQSPLREPTEGEYKSFCGPALDVNLGKFIDKKNHPEIFKEAHDLYRNMHDTAEGLQALKSYKGLGDAFVELSVVGKKQLFVVTEKATRAAEASLSFLGLDDFFQGVQGTDYMGEKVSRTENIHRFIEKQSENGISIDKRNTIFVCGRAKNIEAAKREGYRVIGVTWSEETLDGRQKLRKELFDAGADLIVSSPTELNDVISFAEGWRPRGIKRSPLDVPSLK